MASKFTRRHYEVIAKAINTVTTPDCVKDSEQTGVFMLMDRLCILFKEDNPNFNTDKFLKACGINS